MRVIDGRHSRNIAVTFALSIVRGLPLHDVFPGALAGDHFVDFFNRLSVAAGQGTITFVFDNAPAHRRVGDGALASTHARRWLPCSLLTFHNIPEQAFSC